MALSPSAIGKLHVDLHIAKEALEAEHDKWQSHLDFCSCAPPMSHDKQTRLLNSHKRKIREITDRIHGYEAQIAAL